MPPAEPEAGEPPVRVAGKAGRPNAPWLTPALLRPEPRLFPRPTVQASPLPAIPSGVICFLLLFAARTAFAAFFRGRRGGSGDEPPRPPGGGCNFLGTPLRTSWSVGLFWNLWNPELTTEGGRLAPFGFRRRTAATGCGPTGRIGVHRPGRPGIRRRCGRESGGLGTNGIAARRS